MRRTGFDQFQLFGRALDQRRQHDAAGRQVDPGRQCFGTDANAQQFFLEQFFHDSPIAGQHARMMDADAPNQNLFQLGSDALRPIVLLQARRQVAFAGRKSTHFFPLSCSATVQHCSRLKQNNNAGVMRSSSSSVDHRFDLIGKKRVLDPVKRQRNFAIIAFDQFQFSLVSPIQPSRKFHRVAHRRRQATVS